MTVVAERTEGAWAVRRIRAAMLQTLPNQPKALCRTEEHPDLWHPNRANALTDARAIGICNRCPEQIGCLSYAIRAHPISGIWGGTTEAQREAMFSGHQQREAVLDS